MAKQIIWTNSALHARTDILEFWIKHNKSKTYSRKLSKQIRARELYLSRYNYSGKPTDYKDIRVTFIGYFSMFYRVTPHEIIVIGLWDNRRNPDDLRENLEM